MEHRVIGGSQCRAARLGDTRCRILIALTRGFMLYLGIVFFRSTWPR